MVLIWEVIWRVSLVIGSMLSLIVQFIWNPVQAIRVVKYGLMIFIKGDKPVWEELLSRDFYSGVLMGDDGEYDDFVGFF